MLDQQTQIGTLQVRGVRDDTPAFRLALSSLLNSADLRPIGVPPSAILIIRRMADPLPGRLSPQRNRVRINAEWERSVQQSLADIYHRASRPISGIVPQDADEAVLFADDGEMLASLALDISRGEAIRHWWWKVTMRTLPSSSSDGLKTLLCSKVIYLPAAFYQLAEWKQVVPVVSILSPAQAMTVLSAIRQVYGISDFSTDTTYPLIPAKGDMPEAEDFHSELHTPEYEKKQSEGPSDNQLSYERPDPSARPLWERWVPSTYDLQRLGKERSCLLGLGLALYYEPAFVQTRAFYQAIRGWWSRQEKPSIFQEKKRDEGFPEDAETIHIKQGESEDKHNDGHKIEQDESEDRYYTERKAKQVPKDYENKTQQSKEKSEEDIKIPEDIKLTRIKQDKPEDNRSTEYEISNYAEGSMRETQQDAKANVAESIEPIMHGEHIYPGQEENASKTLKADIEEATTLSFGEGVDTQLGGVLYLINLMVHLNLPACFEDGWKLASEVGPWGVLDVLGRGLLGKDSEYLSNDAIWRVLAELDRREPGELPGENFQNSVSFRLPMNWTKKAFAQKDLCYWATKDSLLRLWSKDGYLLTEVPRDEAVPLVQAKTELQAYMENEECTNLVNYTFDQAPLEQPAYPLLMGLNPNLARWLAMILPYLRFRLQRGLSLSEDEGKALKLDTLAEILLLHQGRLYVTSSHIDLVMSLDDISLPVRLAGLDCNPGWLPDFGRVVLFHFE